MNAIPEKSYRYGLIIRLVGILLAAAALTGCAGANPPDPFMEADRAMRVAARAEALEYKKTGEGANWQNPESDRRGTVIPTRTYESDYGTDCREFQETVTAGQKTDVYVGQSCRGQDGSWTVSRGPHRRGSAASEPYQSRWGYGARYGHFGYWRGPVFGSGPYFSRW